MVPVVGSTVMLSAIVYRLPSALYPEYVKTGFDTGPHAYVAVNDYIGRLVA